MTMKIMLAIVLCLNVIGIRLVIDVTTLRNNITE